MLDLDCYTCDFEKMPKKSKAQRTGTASYDTQLFAFVEASKRYEDKVVKREIIPPRGFLLAEIECLTLM